MNEEARSEPRSAGDWMPVLDQMKWTLGQSLAQAMEPEQILPPQLPAAAEVPLKALDERLARIRACLDRAEQNAQAAEAVLEAEAQAMQRWLEAMRQAGSRLEEWTRRAA